MDKRDYMDLIVVVDELENMDKAVFGILHIEIDIDVERDIDYINRFSFASHDVV